MDPKDATLAAVGWNMTKGGAATTGFAWFLSSEGVGFIGICGVLIGLGMQFYFGRRKDKREEALHKARMEDMKDTEL